MSDKLPRLTSLVSITDVATGKAAQYFTRLWDQFATRIETSLSAIGSTGIIASDGLGSVFGRSVAGGTGITVTNGSGVGGNPSVSLANTAVAAGSYGDGTHVSSFTVDAQGRLTAAASVAVSFPSIPVSSVFGRTGVVVSAIGDYSFSQISGTLAGSQTPAFTGDVTKSAGGTVTVLANIPAISGANLTSLNASNLGSGTVPAARLPNPTSSTLGGVQSAAAVSHQWIASISTAGVPSLSQPAFSDISGSVSAAQTPAYTGDVTKPSGSTVTTLASIPAISGANLTNLNASAVSAGSLALARIATIGSNTILANISGGAAVPAATTLTSILDTISSTQGAVLYRGASSWSALGPGTSGQVLSTGGAAANPSWIPAGGTGTVTSVVGGTGLTGGTITTTGTLAVSYGTTSGTAAQGNDSRLPSDGTFSPVDASGAGLALTVSRGAYTKVGTRYLCDGTVSYPVNANGSNATLGGMPGTFANVGGVGGSFLITSGSSIFLTGIPNQNTTNFGIYSSTVAALTNAQLSGLTLRFQLQVPTV